MQSLSARAEESFPDHQDEDFADVNVFLWLRIWLDEKKM